VHQGAVAYNPYLELAPSFPGTDSIVAVLALVLPAILAGIRWRRHATDLV
jgi:hypothetical protein